VARRTRRPGRVWLALSSAGLIVALTGCQSSGEEPAETETDVVAVEEQPEVEEPKSFALPSSCTDLLPFADYQQLTTEPVSLLRGPGSGSPDPVYAEGSPQEALGGITCLFGDAEETMTYTLSIAPVSEGNRAGIIDGLLAQKYNVDQTMTGGLIYSILGDEYSTPATYNTLFPEAWYEVLVTPGGRIAYEQAERLASLMRDHTFQ
jgi:hypothetical protein